jgi:hypothetical protein
MLTFIGKGGVSLGILPGNREGRHPAKQPLTTSKKTQSYINGSTPPHFLEKNFFERCLFMKNLDTEEGPVIAKKESERPFFVYIHTPS